MIERCFDLRRVKRLADWDLCISRKIIYLIDTEDGKDIGLWTFYPRKNGYVVHADMDKDHRGVRAAKSASDSFEWIFKHTDAEIIIAEIPIKYRKVHVMARHVGMNFDGVGMRGFRCYSLAKQTLMKQREGL